MCVFRTLYKKNEVQLFKTISLETIAVLLLWFYDHLCYHTDKDVLIKINCCSGLDAPLQAFYVTEPQIWRAD